MAMYVRVNLNDRVKCKLTESGKKILKRYREELNADIVARGGRPLKYFEDKPDADGYVSYQLWGLMYTLGPHMILGSEPPIELDVMCEVSDVAFMELKAEAEKLGYELVKKGEE